MSCLPLLQAWKVHLMGPAGCTMNLRKTHILCKAPAPQQGEASTTCRAPILCSSRVKGILYLSMCSRPGYPVSKFNRVWLLPTNASWQLTGMLLSPSCPLGLVPMSLQLSCLCPLSSLHIQGGFSLHSQHQGGVYSLPVDKSPLLMWLCVLCICLHCRERPSGIEVRHLSTQGWKQDPHPKGRPQ